MLSLATTIKNALAFRESIFTSTPPPTTSPESLCEPTATGLQIIALVIHYELTQLFAHCEVIKRFSNLLSIGAASLVMLLLLIAKGDLVVYWEPMPRAGLSGSCVPQSEEAGMRALAASTFRFRWRW